MHAVAAHASVRPAARAARPRLSSRGAFGRAVRSPAHFARSASARVLETRAVFAAVVEPATKVTFPDTYSTHDNTAVMKCLGAGVRQKKIAIINVKVYAVAMYADAEQCAAALEGGDGLLDGKFHKALLVQLVRNVDGKTFWEALDEALVPRIREIATNMATAEDAQGNFMATVAEAAEVAEEAAMAGMDELKDLFEGANLKKDSRVLINWKPGKESATTVTGFEGKLEISVVGADATRRAHIHGARARAVRRLPGRRARQPGRQSRVRSRRRETYTRGVKRVRLGARPSREHVNDVARERRGG